MALCQIEFDIRTFSKQLETPFVTLDVRRRFRTILYSDTPYLLDYMIFGIVDHKVDPDPDHNEKKKPDQATSITRNYFMKGYYSADFTTESGDSNNKDDDEDDDVQDEDEKIKELEIRLQTGGSLFVVEESELLQSGRIHVLCELLSTMNDGGGLYGNSHVQLITLYVPILIHHAVELLSLEFQSMVIYVPSNTRDILN